jgi:hypothetical protein
MATSGTTSFNLDIDDIIEEAYERCGLSVAIVVTILNQQEEV